MAYLTDVFIIPEFQGKGLGKWLMACINEKLESWPYLRSAMLFTGGEQAVRFYKEVLGMRTFISGVDGLELMEKVCLLRPYHYKIGELTFSYCREDLVMFLRMLNGTYFGHRSTPISSAIQMKQYSDLQNLGFFPPSLSFK